MQTNVHKLRNLSIDVLKTLPEDSSLEDIMSQIHLIAQTLEGLEDEKNKNTISTSMLLKRLSQWKQK